MKCNCWYKVKGQEPQTGGNLTVTEKDKVKMYHFYIDAGGPLDMNEGVSINFDLGELDGWMADYRCTEYWCQPAFGTDTADIPDETQGLIYRRKNGLWGVILPVVGEEYKCVLRGSEAVLFSWCDNICICDTVAFVQAEGDDPFELLRQCAKAAKEGYPTWDQREYPEIFEYLGWCSWDAFQIRINEEDVIKKCEEFKKKNIPVRWAILDDMWAEVRNFYGKSYNTKREMIEMMHDSPLDSFEADPIRFPNGLKGCIDRMKEYGLKVGVWHPTTGYWKGIARDSALAEQLKDCLYDAGDRLIHSSDEEKAYAFYKSFHDHLLSCGADFVKIDNQTMTRRFYKNCGPVGQVAKNFHAAMERSVAEHFGVNMINCMGMGSEDMFNRPWSAVSRCSDDFQPEDRAWFIHHILMCSYNGLIQGQYFVGDWDMWWTDDAQAQKNSVLRAASGGPIYISDTLERSRRDKLTPLVLDDGRILRCDRPAIPTLDCLVHDPRKGGLFKVQNIADGAGILAVFNLSDGESPVSGSISPSNVWGLDGERFGVYEHFTGEFHVLDKNSAIDISLKDHDDIRLYIIIPLKDGCGDIGFLSKFISPKTIGMTGLGRYGLVRNETLYIEDR